jgi:hypothetical protein
METSTINNANGLNPFNRFFSFVGKIFNVRKQDGQYSVANEEDEKEQRMLRHERFKTVAPSKNYSPWM